jgi:hypothetical protein
VTASSLIVTSTYAVANLSASGGVTASNIGTVANTTLNIKTNNTNQFIIDGAGNMGVGAAVVAQNKFNFTATHVATDNSSSLNITTNVNNTTTSSANNTAGVTNTYNVLSGSTNATPQVHAMYNNMVFSFGAVSTVTTGSYRVLRNNITINSPISFSAAGSPASIIGHYNNLQTSGTINGLNLPSYIGFCNNFTFAATTTGSISNLYGAYLFTPNIGVGNMLTSSNVYGLYVDNQLNGSTSVTNGYSIYQAGTLDNNVFRGSSSFGINSKSVNAVGVGNNMAVGSGYVATAAPTNGAIIQGNVSIGQTTNVNKLDVNGNVSASAVTASVVGVNSPSFAFTASLQTGSFTVIENAGVPLLYYRTFTGVLKSASLN